MRPRSQSCAGQTRQTETRARQHDKHTHPQRSPSVDEVRNVLCACGRRVSRSRQATCDPLVGAVPIAAAPLTCKLRVLQRSGPLHKVARRVKVEVPAQHSCARRCQWRQTAHPQARKGRGDRSRRSENSGVWQRVNMERCTRSSTGSQVSASTVLKKAAAVASWSLHRAAPESARPHTARTLAAQRTLAVGRCSGSPDA